MSNTALNRSLVALLTNQSGGSVAQGDVVIVDSANASAFTTTTTAAYASGSIGVVLEPNGIASGASGTVAFGGWVPKINLSASASLGDLVKTHTVAKQAARHASPVVTGDFGEVLGTGTSPAAFLWGAPAQSGGGSGTVTSVAMTVPTGFSVSGSPVTGSGTLAVTESTQAANLVKAGPSSGAAATPGYRALVSADLPSAPTVSGEITSLDIVATGLTGATAASRYVGATASGAPASGTFLKGDFIIDQTGKVYICTTAGSPGTWTAAGVSTLAGDTDVSISSPANFSQLQYQTADSKWHNIKAGLVPLNQVIVGAGGAASVSFSSIPSGYSDLEIHFTVRGDAAVTQTPLLMQFNSDTSAIYDWSRLYSDNSVATAEGQANSSAQIGFVSAASGTANAPSDGMIRIGRYADTTFHKAATSLLMSKVSTSGAGIYTWQYAASWRSTAAITAIALLTGAGNFVQDSVFTLYGRGA